MENAKKLLENLSFGEDVAEQERKQLQKYFVRTRIWNDVTDGSRDIVFGPKGSGKSAIYFQLKNEADNLFAKNKAIILQTDDSIGESIFTSFFKLDLAEYEKSYDESIIEKKLINIWKLYFLVLITKKLNELNIKNEKFEILHKVLDRAGLLNPEFSNEIESFIGNRNTLKGFLRKAIDFIEKFFSNKGIEVEVEFFGIKTTISKNENKKAVEEDKKIKISALYELLNSLLVDEKLKFWILVDGLDSIFESNSLIESNSIRALIRTYQHFYSLTNIRLIMFLRDDIWRSVISGRTFRLATHYLKDITISWREEEIVNLIARRILACEKVKEAYEINEDSTYGSITQQRELINSILEYPEPEKNIVYYLINKVKDGNGQFTPREIVRWLNIAKSEELNTFELGGRLKGQNKLISFLSVKKSFKKVAEHRFYRTLTAENTNLIWAFDKFKNFPTSEFNLSILRKYVFIGNDDESIISICDSLVEVGFFSKKYVSNDWIYSLPDIYYTHLNGDDNR